MTDFHSHVLPGIDDGSRSPDMSAALLRAAAEQGIRCICATSHFYPTDERPETFLKRRARALDALADVLEPDFPRIVPGAEVYYFSGISRVDAVGDLRIQGTPLLLLEMPFSEWSDSMVNEIMQLHRKPGITVLMAHIERYLRWQRPEVWDALLHSGVLMQSNAEFFLSWRTRRRAVRMLREGQIHFLGSDCHNTTSRPQKMGEALKAIGPEGLRILEENISRFAPEFAPYAAV